MPRMQKTSRNDELPELVQVEGLTEIQLRLYLLKQRSNQRVSS